MGFDLFISLRLQIDPKTGLPFVYNSDSSRKPYDPSEFLVPEKYRKWAIQRGHVFHYYIRDLDEGEPSASAETFLDKYPEWDDVKGMMILDGEDEDTYDWSETDHNEFKEALEWFSSKVYFVVVWSY